MTNSSLTNPGPAPASFEDWCKLSGFDRDFVRRNYSAVRARYEADPLTPTRALPPRNASPYDRNSEI